MAARERVDKILSRIDSERHLFEAFGTQVETVIGRGPPDIARLVHSTKRRIKSHESLRGKIQNKRSGGVDVNSSNVLDIITDICGVRVLHLFPQDISPLRDHIDKCISDFGWHLFEQPTAYSWDPESVEYLERLGFQCSLKPNYYTSVHYVVRPRADSVVSCEIQVRSLLEEVWAEVDHKVKYKKEHADVRDAEHLAVLARLVGAGSKLISVLHK